MQESQPKQERVLLIEDDRQVRESIAEWLAAVGYDVLEAGDGLEAFDLMNRTGPPDVVVLDLMMPGMDGWEFIEEMRDDKDLSAVPLVVVTAARDACVRDVDAFLAKPFRATDLLEAIRDELGR